MLKVSDELFECRLLAQALEIGIQPEERPASEPRVDAAFQPRHRRVRFPKHRVDAGDIVVGVVGVAEGTRGIERATNTLQGEVRLTAPGVQHALKGDEPGLLWCLLQGRRQPLLGELQASAQQRRDYASSERVHISGTFSEPGLRCPFRALEVPTKDMEPLEVTGPCFRIHEHTLLVGDARFREPSDMQANTRHPVMGPLADAHVSLGVTKLFFSGDRSGTERELRRAIALNPQHALARCYLALHLGTVGRSGEARADAGRVDDARQVLEELKKRRAKDDTTALSLAYVYTKLGEMDLALDWAAKAIEERNAFAWAGARFPGMERLASAPGYDA